MLLNTKETDNYSSPAKNLVVNKERIQPPVHRFARKAINICFILRRSSEKQKINSLS